MKSHAIRLSKTGLDLAARVLGSQRSARATEPALVALVLDSELRNAPSHSRWEVPTCDC